MTSLERVQRALDTACKVRATLAAEDDVETFHPMVLAWRGSLCVAQLTPRSFDTESLAELLFKSITGFRADAAVFVTDSYLPGVPVNPDTARPWEPGELGPYMERHGRDGAVTEALVATGFNAAGDLVALLRQYSVTSNAFGVPQVKWQDTLGPGAALIGSEGFIVKAGQAAMNKVHKFTEHIITISTEANVTLAEADAIADYHIAERLDSMADVILMTDDEAQRAIIERMSGRSMHDNAEDAIAAWRAAEEEQS